MTTLHQIAKQKASDGLSSIAGLSPQSPGLAASCACGVAQLGWKLRKGRAAVAPGGSLQVCLQGEEAFHSPAITARQHATMGGNARAGKEAILPLGHARRLAIVSPSLLVVLSPTMTVCTIVWTCIAIRARPCCREPHERQSKQHQEMQVEHC